MKHVVYHANCDDGFGAAYAARMAFCDDNGEYDKDVRFVAQNYGDPLRVLYDKDDEFYFLDYCPKPEVMTTIKCKRVVVIDHHVTVQRFIKDLDEMGVELVFDTNKSGCILAWEYFHPQLETPWLFDHIQDRDLWQFKLEGTKEVIAALRTRPHDFDTWLDFVETNCYREFMSEGKAIIKHIDAQIKKHCDRAVLREFDGYLVPMVNATAYWSEIGNELLYKYVDAPFAMVYFDREDSVRQYSLRSREDFDVSKIAEAYGGGGHKCAAGFERKLTV